MFPRKPFLDRVIVEVTPVEKFFEQSIVKTESGEQVRLDIPLDDARVKYRSDRGIVRAVGDGVAMAGVFIEMPVQVGDEVFFDADNAYAGQIWMLPSDKNKTGLPEYLEIRVGDLLGRSPRYNEHEDKVDDGTEDIMKRVGL
jgi:co-chaperonin GroES (HSP10)